MGIDWKNIIRYIKSAKERTISCERKEKLSDDEAMEQLMNIIKLTSTDEDTLKFAKKLLNCKVKVCVVTTNSLLAIILERDYEQK